MQQYKSTVRLTRKQCGVCYEERELSGGALAYLTMSKLRAWSEEKERDRQLGRLGTRGMSRQRKAIWSHAVGVSAD